MAEMKDLLGKTLNRLEVDSDELVFYTTEGKIYKLYHEQVCDECVYIESVLGDLDDLGGSPIIFAEESTNREHPEGYTASEHKESFTWTFYGFATLKGSVEVRWLGESNGCYSERVDFTEIC
jgi:hypothetical protein